MAVFVFHSRMSQNRDLASPNDRELNLMPKAPIESFWDALWLELWLFLCVMVECRRIVRDLASPNDRELNMMPKAPIERASGTPCGSRYGCFCVSL